MADKDDEQRPLTDKELIWVRKIKARAESAKFFGGFIIAIVIGWNAFTGGLQSMASYFMGDK